MNVVLIGMPGCGKSSVGRLAAERTGRTFLELDALIEQREGCAIRDIFAERGEDYFRQAETRITREAAARENAVISTGGGVILRSENMEALTATGTIFFLDRDPGEIAKENHANRPLLAGGREKVFTLYTQRIELYKKYAEYVVKCGPEVENTLERLLEIMGREGLL